MKGTIKIITRQCVAVVNPDAIIYIKKFGRKITIVTKIGAFSKYEKIENIDEFLDKRFYHPNSKLVVNLDEIELISGNSVHFKTGEELALGRDSFIRLKQQLSVYLRGNGN